MQACQYSQYSLECTKCEKKEFGADGLACQSCSAGEGPNENQTGCATCLGEFDFPGTSQPTWYYKYSVYHFCKVTLFVSHAISVGVAPSAELKLN